MTNEKVVKHEWGYELNFTDSKEYCGKILAFGKEGSKTNLFFQKTKDKTWFVNAGAFIVRWIDPVNASLLSKELKEGETYHVPALQCAQLESLIPNSSVTEVSNYADRNDEQHVIKGQNIS